ncbi:ABC transporter ATP-binding protein [Epibacterium sp. Ofav1-8]|uniref:ABC transporter ATP-binding protein n=1 Tax=Epibacterium sp. Ofav1-8 TaxID=2917735 RepID=UPI001EF72671|nr:ABC transporter ATP-binding protein [Epibacterium sp. Ofav1-8]MCG7625155.1 ABC transporter ATP-binding protein [Epibacterium sp. Ofav1-8]
MNDMKTRGKFLDMDTFEAVRIDNVSKYYGAVAAVKDVDCTVQSGEFLTLLGPSGSGKTTLLMMLAGFTTPSEGQIWVDTKDITHVPPEQRNFGVVFQGYALFPHMTVFDNVAYPLRLRKMPARQIRQKVEQILSLVRLDAYADRHPRQLSGGQQQRTALARTLVYDPILILLDESLGALDKQLRGELQQELKALHRQLGRTFVNVTHDQQEALDMSDRIVVMNEGGVEQIGTPRELYERPNSRFVVEFLGDSNLLPTSLAFGGTDDPSRSALIRPEAISIGASDTKPTGEDQMMVRATVRSTSYFGSDQLVEVALDSGLTLRVRVNSAHAIPIEEGGSVSISWERRNLHLVDN